MSKNNRTKVYKKMLACTAKYKESNDCAVIALAVLTDTPYKTVRNMLKEQGRKKGGSTQWGWMLKVFDKLGFKATHMDYNKFLEDNYKGKRQVIRTNDMTKFPEIWNNGKRYIFWIPGHVAAIKDGLNHDWTCNYSKWMGAFYEITPKD